MNSFHDRYEAVFVLSGKLIVSVGGSVYECKAGTAAVFKACDMHYIKLCEKEYTEYMLVSFSLSEDLSFDIASVTELSVLQKQVVLNICNEIPTDEYNMILPSVFVENSFSVLKLAASLKLLVIDIAINKTQLPQYNKRDSILFSQAVAEMEKNILGQLSLENLAENLGISLSHLKRIFAGFTDVGAHEFFMQFKIVKAIGLLKSGRSVTETAELTGFNNQNYFSAAFKRMVGVSPKEYCSVKKRKTAPKTVREVKREAVPVPQKTKASDMPSYLL